VYAATLEGSMASPGKPTCNAPVYWWEGEYDMNCIRLEGHEGDHFDGLSWYDDDMTPKDDDHEEKPDGVIEAPRA
jgi:hypothetical protein